MPFAGREVAASPSVPTSPKISNAELSWAATDSKLKFAVYYFSNLNEEGELVGVTPSKTMTIAKNGFYAVTALNADNVESAPSTEIKKK